MSQRLLPNLNQRGVSLIEVLMVILIIGFIVMVVAIVPQSIRLTGVSSQQSLANQIAAKRIEDLRLLTYSSLANGTTSITDSRISSLPEGSGSAIISDCPVGVCNNSESIKQVKVIVNWKENGQDKNVTVTTLIGDGGLR